MTQQFIRGDWIIEVENGDVLVRLPGRPSRVRMLEVEAFDLRRALGDALDHIQRQHGHTLAALEATIPRPLRCAPARGPDDVPALRRMTCKSYDGCLGVAESRQWPSFTCDSCQAYQDKP